jgi:thiamine biosynthesis lipoprotein
MEATGYAQGTTYNVIYYNDGTDLQYQIDSLLVMFDRVLSTYQESSFISKWNRGEVDSLEQPFLFQEVVSSAVKVNSETNGALDITVAPLMDHWFKRNWTVEAIDSTVVDSIMEFVGSVHLFNESGKWKRDDARIRLDVNAIAQGYSVDVVSRFLESKGIFNYLVEIGGEVNAKGMKPDGSKWKIGIDKPSDDGNLEHEMALSVLLNDRSLATSGNYRKSVEINGQRFGHTLDPATGYPAQTDVLSATVIASDCMTADAYATACMVLGFEKAKTVLTSRSDLKGILIYSKPDGTVDTWMSDGIETAEK